MKQAAIATADALLRSAELPAYGELATLLRAADNKLSALATYHSVPPKQAIEALHVKLGDAVDKIPD